MFWRSFDVFAILQENVRMQWKKRQFCLCTYCHHAFEFLWSARHVLCAWNVSSTQSNKWVHSVLYVCVCVHECVFGCSSSFQKYFVYSRTSNITAQWGVYSWIWRWFELLYNICCVWPTVLWLINHCHWFSFVAQ